MAVSKVPKDDKKLEFIRALEEAVNYLEYSTEKAEFCDNEYYLAVRDYLEQVLKELKT